MTNRYHRLDSTAPFGKAAAITPNDSATFAQTDSIAVGTAGNLAVTMADGSNVTIPVPAGILNFAITAVKATGTTAANIVALYRDY